VEIVPEQWHNYVRSAPKQAVFYRLLISVVLLIRSISIYFRVIFIRLITHLQFGVRRQLPHSVAGRFLSGQLLSGSGCLGILCAVIIVRGQIN